MKIGGKILVAMAILALLLVPLAACEGTQGTSGTSGATGATGATGPEGARGPAGQQGEQGPAGGDGADGADGSMWYSGGGIPTAGLGADGDFFLNTANGGVWQKDGNTWEMVDNLSGAAGAAGPMGPAGTVGPNLLLTGWLQVNGNTTLGDNCGVDTLTVNAVADFNCDVDANATLDVTGLITGTGGLDLELFDVTDGTGSLNIGAGNFTVAGATGDTHIVGNLQVLGSNSILGDACTDILTVNAVANFLCVLHPEGDIVKLAASPLYIDAAAGQCVELRPNGGTWQLSACATGVTIANDLTVNQNANLNLLGGATTVYGVLHPEGDIVKTAASSLWIASAAGQTITLAPAGVLELTLSGTGGGGGLGFVSVVNDLNVGNDLYVNHDVTLGTTCADTLIVNAVANFGCNVNVNTTMFNVVAATGATHVAGNFDVATTMFTVASATGVTHVAGNFDVATTMFTVASATGATHVAGNFDVNTNKFVVTASDGSLNIGPGNFTVAGATGITHVAGNFDVAGTMFTVASATGDTHIARDLDVDHDVNIDNDLVVDHDVTIGTLPCADNLIVNAVASFNCNTILGSDDADDITFLGEIQGQYPMIFEGGTDNGNETRFLITDPSSDNVITFPNATITVNAAGDLSGTTLAAGVTFSSLTQVGTLTSGTWQAGVIGDSWIVDALTINGGTITNSPINNTTIGATTRSTGNFTTLDANDSLTIGTGGATLAIQRHLSATGTVGNGGAAIANGAFIVDTITVNGAVSGDTVVSTPPSSIEAGLIWFVYISGNDTVTVILYNTTANPINSADNTWRADVWQH